MGKNREAKKEKQYNKKSSGKEVLNGKYIRRKEQLFANNLQKLTKLPTV